MLSDRFPFSAAVVAGLAQLSHRISEDISTRATLESEREHYNLKCARLQSEFQVAGPATKDAIKEKLSQNQAKLR